MRDLILLLLFMALILVGCTPEAPKAPAPPTSSYAMNCAMVESTHETYRCENKEVVCYASFEVGLSCHWK